MASALLHFIAAGAIVVPHGKVGGAGQRARSSHGSMMADDGACPSLVVLDLDMCVWTPEMYELYEMPSADKVTRGELNGRGEGVTGVYSGNRVIRLFPGALVALQESYDGVHEGMKLAVASSADTPLAEQIGRAAMRILEVVPGISVYDGVLA